MAKSKKEPIKECFTILESPFPYVLFIEEREYRRYLKQKGWQNYKNELFTHSNATAQFFTLNGKCEFCCVCLNHERIKTFLEEEVYSTILHEAVHIWQEVLLFWGESKASSEIEAYSIQRIFLNLVDQYKSILNGKS